MHASYVTKILPWTKFENQLVRHYGHKPLPTNGDFKMHFPALRFWRTVANFDSIRESGYLLPNRRIDERLAESKF